MPSLDYEEIYSCFYGKAEAHGITLLPEELAIEFLNTWLHSSISRPEIRSLFSTCKLDDDLEELSFSLNVSLGEDYDKEFVTELLGLGIGIGWITRQTYSQNLSDMVFGSKEEKYYSQAAHGTFLRTLKHDWKKEMSQLICDHGSKWNGYLDNI